ncbi:hypothetical protein WMY93_030580 [Mugilogobius chulae]|uniref:C2 domain-containing protein n=1 Tax=Mugilogobius chulae TaxID=88201 RepID=A0AAW0MLZ1_9GOBI
MKIAVLLLLLQVVQVFCSVQYANCHGKKLIFTVTEVNLNKKTYQDIHGAPDLYLRTWFNGKRVKTTGFKYGHRVIFNYDFIIPKYISPRGVSVILSDGNSPIRDKNIISCAFNPFYAYNTCKNKYGTLQFKVKC